MLRPSEEPVNAPVLFNAAHIDDYVTTRLVSRVGGGIQGMRLRNTGRAGKPLCISLAIAGAAFCAQALAFEPDQLTFGIELTATTDQNPQYDITKPISGKLVDIVYLMAKRFADLAGGLLEPNPKYPGEWSVTTTLGKWNFENDTGVMEVVSPPLHLADLDSTRLVFQAFNDLGLKPEVKPGGEEGGGGHLHIGKHLFAADPLLLRNLMVSLMNHTFIGATLEEAGDDQANSLRDRGLIRFLKPELDRLDAAFASGQSVTIEEVARAFIRSFQDGTDRAVPVGDDIYDWDARYLDVNLTNLLTGLHPTVEFRMLRAPRSTGEVKTRVAFFVAYLQKLSKLKRPIPLKYFSEGRRRWLEMPSVIYAQWMGFVQSLGLSAKDYKDFWETRFPLLSTQTAEAGGRTYRIEVRTARSQMEARRILEVRAMESEEDATANVTPPKLDLTIGGSILRPKFQAFQNGIWLARVEIPNDPAPPSRNECENILRGTP